MQLKQFLIQLLSVDYQSEIDQVVDCFELKKIRKHHFFLLKNSKPDKVGYLADGLCRGFYSDEEGNQHTTNFFTSPTFLADFNSYVRSEPIKLNIQALTDCTVYVARLSRIYALAEQHIILNKLFRITFEGAYTHQQARQVSFITMDAKRRYLDFVERNRDIIEQVPQKYIASYLGIQPQSLSRIRKEISSGKA